MPTCSFKSEMGKKCRSSANEVTGQFAEPGRIFWKGLDFSFLWEHPQLISRSLDPQSIQGYSTSSTTSAGIVPWQLAQSWALSTISREFPRESQMPVLGGNQCFTGTRQHGGGSTAPTLESGAQAPGRALPSTCWLRKHSLPPQPWSADDWNYTISDAFLWIDPTSSGALTKTKKKPNTQTENTPKMEGIFSFSYGLTPCCVTLCTCLTNPFTTVTQLFYSTLRT